jgi:hypothetical protein
MKPTAMPVNTSREPVVDERALVEAVRAGRLAGAAPDVFETEPLDPASPLTQLEDVILAPHLGSHSVEGVALHRAGWGNSRSRRPPAAFPSAGSLINKDLYNRVAALPECSRVTRY